MTAKIVWTVLFLINRETFLFPLDIYRVYTVEITKRVFNFRFEARTSRGIMPDRPCWFLKIRSAQYPTTFGIGEVAPLFGLSLETLQQVEEELDKLPTLLANATVPLNADPLVLEQSFRLSSFSSSMKFGVIMALLDLYHGGRKKYFDCPFFEGTPMPINGLVWMADAETMLEKAEEKIFQGFNCIKLKVGGLDFEKECSVLQTIRSKFSPQELTIRLDANGAFTKQDVAEKLALLSSFHIHSIEQPLKPAEHLGYPDILFNSPIPVALDEQLIGRFSLVEKDHLVQALRPSFLVLKPGMVGGFSDCQQWISVAQNRGVGWWITSALESPLGLSAIAQFASLFDPEIPQGLGTGQVFEELFDHPLVVEKGHLWLNSAQKWGF